MVDDLSSRRCCPPMAEAQAQATATSPDLQAAKAGIPEAGYDTEVRALSVSAIAAGSIFFTASTPTSSPSRPSIPPRRRAQHAAEFRISVSRQNLGYVGAGDAEHSGVELGRDAQQGQAGGAARAGARLDLTLAQRTLQGNWPRRTRKRRARWRRSNHCASPSNSRRRKSAPDAAALSGGRSDGAGSGGSAEHCDAGAQRV